MGDDRRSFWYEWGRGFSDYACLASMVGVVLSRGACDSGDGLPLILSGAGVFGFSYASYYCERMGTVLDGERDPWSVL